MQATKKWMEVLSLPVAFVIELVDGLFDENIAAIDMQDVSCLSA